MLSSLSFSATASTNLVSPDNSIPDFSVDVSINPPDQPASLDDYDVSSDPVDEPPLEGSDVSNNPAPASTFNLMTSSNDFLMMPPAITNPEMADSSDEEELALGDVIATCTRKSESSQCEMREPPEQPPQGDETAPKAPPATDKTPEKNNNKCPPDFYGSSQYVMCNNPDSPWNIAKIYRAAYYTLHNAIPCKFTCFF